MRLVKVVIIDRNSITRRGYSTFIGELGPPYAVVATFDQLRGFDGYVQERSIDIVILEDQTLHPIEVAGWIEHCYQRYPGLSIVVVSTRKSSDYLDQIMKRGTASFVYKNGDFERMLLTALRMAAEKQPFISGEVVRLVTGRLSGKITERELDVLRLMERGHSVREIRLRLGISSKTIYRARDKLKRALGVQTTEQIVDAARRRGWLDNRFEGEDGLP